MFYDPEQRSGQMGVNPTEPEERDTIPSPFFEPAVETEVDLHSPPVPSSSRFRAVPETRR